MTIKILLERLLLRIPVARVWARRWQRERLIREEVVVGNVGQAQWVVIQIDGHIRYVASRLFARDHDIAYLKRELITACYSTSKRRR